MNPVVSVIMPVRNGGAYLQAAVNSILEQSLGQLELILVDDHSDDQALERLPSGDQRIHLIKNAGRGVASAFNTGMNHARGAYIARMDADDIALPERLERQTEYLAGHPDIGICGACVEIFSDSGVADGNRRYQNWLNGCRSPDTIHRELFVESPLPNPTVLFRRQVLTTLGGYRDPVWPEDYDLLLRADGLGIRMGKPEGILLHWRDHELRLTRTDKRYRLEQFQAAKAHFLCHQRLAGEKPVVIWGAGPSGRLMHDLIQAEGSEVLGFLDVHPRRIGQRKRGLPVWPIDRVGRLQGAFVLVAVGAAGAREKIRGFMDGRGQIEGEQYLFVC